MVTVIITVSYEIKFIDGARFMVSSFSHLVGNLSEGIHKVKCKDCNFFLNMKLSKII